jgi:hypothetical protein
VEPPQCKHSEAVLPLLFAPVCPEVLSTTVIITNSVANIVSLFFYIGYGFVSCDGDDDGNDTKLVTRRDAAYSWVNP